MSLLYVRKTLLLCLVIGILRYGVNFRQSHRSVSIVYAVLCCILLCCIVIAELLETEVSGIPWWPEIPTQMPAAAISECCVLRLAVPAGWETGRANLQQDAECAEYNERVHLSIVLHLYQPHQCRFRQRLTQHQRRESVLRHRHAYWRSVASSLSLVAYF